MSVHILLIVVKLCVRTFKAQTSVEKSLMLCHQALHGMIFFSDLVTFRVGCEIVFTSKSDPSPNRLTILQSTATDQCRHGGCDVEILIIPEAQKSSTFVGCACFLLLSCSVVLINHNYNQNMF